MRLSTLRAVSGSSTSTVEVGSAGDFFRLRLDAGRGQRIEHGREGIADRR